MFKELHCAGHLMWDFIDPDHDEFDAKRHERFGRPLEALYRQADAAVGALIAAAGDGARIVLSRRTICAQTQRRVTC